MHEQGRLARHGGLAVRAGVIVPVATDYRDTLPLRQLRQQVRQYLTVAVAVVDHLDRAHLVAVRVDH